MMYLNNLKRREKQLAVTGNAIENIGGGFTFRKAIKESPKPFTSFFNNLHTLLNLEVTKILFPYTRLFSDADHALLGERSTDFTECGSGTGVRRDVEVETPVRGAALAGNETVEIGAGVAGLGDAGWS
ncbi:hypothetical protein MtrunA17_Chr1g0191421 [Medicago truncatula]|uniref:Uncharacterized protein n=1 Tax=Medicago truncatula TaxID=3880 RepID=A0A396JR29_MEDTR|nr:hypothetical protein MtrunA17_Chr1g0191421 [Medicago truncatula]